MRPLLILLIKSFSKEARHARWPNGRRETNKRIYRSRLDKITKSSQEERDLEKQTDALNKATEADYDNLSKKEQFALWKYSASFYQNSSKIISGQKKATEKEKKTIEDLDSATMKMSLPEGRILYKALNVARLIPDGPIENTYSAFRKVRGSWFKDPNFGSTSISEKQASVFLNPNRVLLEIRVPKGTRGSFLGSTPKEKEILDLNNLGSDLDLLGGKGLSERSASSHELEFLLPRERVYKIRKVRQDSDGLVVLSVDLLNRVQKPDSIID